MVYSQMPPMAHEDARTVGALLLLLLLVDALVVGGLSVPSLARRGPALTTASAAPSEPGAPKPPVTVPPEQRGWALCQTRFADQDVTPSTIAVTYLDTALDETVAPEEVRGWFGDLPARAIEVYKLEDKLGRRRISFEVPRRSWPEWDGVVGDAAGELVCARLRTALKGRGVGRPGLKPSEAEASRYDFEFLHARRFERYRAIELVGNLDRALSPRRFDDLKAWLAAGSTAAP
jgi:hypothetical protein